MQTRAIIEAALTCKAKGIKALPEIMVPLIGSRFCPVDEIDASASRD